MKINLDRFEETPKKKPLDRKIIADMLKKGRIWDFLVLFGGVPAIAGFGWLASLAHHLLTDIFAWLFYGMATLLAVEIIIPMILLPFGKFTVSLDAMCRKEIVYRRHGDHIDTDYVFYFSHHGSYNTTPSLYSYSEPGQLFYVVSFAGHKWSPSKIFHTHMYEWIGPPEDVGGVVPERLEEEARVFNETILARRPLTKGRKTRLTDEEIIRDLLENRRALDELLIKLGAGLLVVASLLFFVSAAVAKTALSIVGAACAVLLVQRLIGKKRVEKHRFILTKDTLMDKDPITRGIWRWKKMNFVLSFRQSGTYRIPRADESVYYDAELGDAFFIVRMEGKSKKIRAVYNGLDYDWD